MSAAAAPLRLGADPASARALCVFLHGRGQTPEAMAETVIGRLCSRGMHYLLPRAEGGSWYDARAIDPLTQVTRDQLEAALDQISRDIDAARAAGAPRAPMLLAGFSQGACLAIEWAMRHGGWAGGLCALTGCRVGAPGNGRPAAALPGLPVYASCGDADDWIPLFAFFAATQALGSAGARLRADVFPGRPHEIGPQEIGVLDAMLAGVAAGSDPLGGA